MPILKLLVDTRRLFLGCVKLRGGQSTQFNARRFKDDAIAMRSIAAVGCYERQKLGRLVELDINWLRPVTQLKPLAFEHLCAVDKDRNISQRFAGNQSCVSR